MQHRSTWLSVAVVALFAASCGNPQSTLVDGGVRSVTIARSTTTSEACDATHAVSCVNSTGCCAAPETCVLAFSTTAGGVNASICAVCPADHPSACSQTTCCLTDSACVMNGTLSQIGKCRCATGETECGELCCPAGASCSGGECRTCPASAPNLCGTECQSDPCPSDGTGGGTGGACSPSTGCGNGWLSSCDGRCYDTSADCQAAGPPQNCYSGSCRRCP